MKKLGSLTSMLWSVKQLQEILSCLSYKNKQLCGFLMPVPSLTKEELLQSDVKNLHFKFSSVLFLKGSLCLKKCHLLQNAKTKACKLYQFTIFIMSVVTACRMKILLLFALFFTYICDVQHVWSWFSSKFHFLSP